MVKPCRRGVSLSQLWVASHERASDFYLSSWQRGESPVPMLVVRLALAALAVATFSWSVSEAPTRFWPIYLTNWGLVLLVAMTLSAVLVSFVALCGTIDDTSELPWYIGIYWVYYNVIISLAIVITTLYWLLLFDNEAEIEPRALGLDVATHAVNSCVALTELVASRTPVRLLHVYQPLSVGLWYAAFTGIYYAAGGTDANGLPYVYEVLDWREGGRTGGVVAASAAGLLLVYFVLWVLAQLRDKVADTLVRTTSQDLPSAPPLTATFGSAA